MTGPALCPTGCGRTRRTGHLMCSTCWASVPTPLQRDVYRTWRAWSQNKADADKMRAYTAAHDAAIASIP